MVSSLDFRSEGRWFDALFLPSRCILRQETLPHIRLYLPRYRRRTAGGNPAIDWHPIQWGVAILSVASCYRNRDKLRPYGPPWLVCDLTLAKQSKKSDCWSGLGDSVV